MPRIMLQMIPRAVLALVVLLALSLTVAAPALAQTATPPAWDGLSRFTVLVMGMDRRPDMGRSISVRTDVMIVVSLNPEDQSIGMLHIPRDIHLTPYNTVDFIRANSLLITGELMQEGSGPYYAMDTVQYNLGIYIDRYLMFDFRAFEAVVDAIGGIEITTDYIISDPEYPDMNYGFDPFYLPAGTHLLDGHRALQFARTRHGDNDFVRGIRQLQVMQAVQDRVANGGLLPSLIRQAPTLFSQLQGNVYTDLTLDDIVQLAMYVVQVPQDKIRTGTINTDYNLIYALPNGRNAYIPDRARLAELMVEIFGDNYAQ